MACLESHKINVMRKTPPINLEEILTDRAREEDLLEIPLRDKVFKFFLFFGSFTFFLVFLQFLNVGLFKSDFYFNRALLNASDVKIEPAPRGIIFDRFGKPLVRNEPSFNVFLVPTKLPESSSGKLEALKKISSILNIDLDELKERLREKDWSRSDKLFLTNDLTHEKLVNLSSEEVAGLKTEPSFKRAQLPPFKFAHLLGYTGLVSPEDLKKDSKLTADDEIGKSGLEAYYDSYLRGSGGREVFFRNAKGQITGKKESSPPSPGANLETFIDKELQEYFYDRLQNALKYLGKDTGVGIAMNPKNGEILSMFSIPSFDSLEVHEYLTRSGEPLFNRAIGGLYTPGSTIKPLVALAALEEGIVLPETKIFSAGFIEIPNPYNPENPSIFFDWKPHGWVDLRSAIAKSSNVYFYEVGGGYRDQVGLGIEKLRTWWQKFNLDQKTMVDLPGEKAGFLPWPGWKEEKLKEFWRIGDTYNVSIGQGDLVITPLELLNYVSAIANGGYFYKPRIVKYIKNEKGEILFENTPQVVKMLDESVYDSLEEVREGMKDAVLKSYGTANLLSDLPIKVAAKTGSSQVDNKTKINAFFVGYAPADDPEIAILVLVENAREGSLNVVPVAKEVFLWYYNNRLNPKP